MTNVIVTGFEETCNLVLDVLEELRVRKLAVIQEETWGLFTTGRTTGVGRAPVVRHSCDIEGYSRHVAYVRQTLVNSPLLTTAENESHAACELLFTFSRPIVNMARSCLVVDILATYVFHL